MRLYFDYWYNPATTPSIHASILKGDAKGLDSMLSGATSINTRDCDGNTPLAVASFCNNVEIVRMLLSSGAHVNAKDSKRQTPLHKAARQGNYEIVAELINHKADVDRRKCREETPLMLACARGHADTVKLLLDNGASVELRDMYDRLPVHWAIKGGSLDCVQHLQDKGAKFGVLDKFHKNAVFQAAKSNQPEILSYLLRQHPAGAHCEDSKLRSPLVVAAANNHSQCLACLLAHPGLSAETACSSGRTPLMEAAFCGSWDCVQMLLEHGVNPSTTDQHGSTPLILAILGQLSCGSRGRNKPWFNVIFTLVNANTDLTVHTNNTVFWDRNIINQHSQNALELAVKAGQTEVVKLLARAGSPPGNLETYFKLTTKNLPVYLRKHSKLYDWVKRFFKSPRPLQEKCRSSYRSYLGSDWLRKVDLLPVAPGVARYLKLGDMDDLKEAYGKDMSKRQETAFKNKLEDEDKSEHEYEPSAYDSDWYGKLDTIIDTDSEPDDEDDKVDCHDVDAPGNGSSHAMGGSGAGGQSCFHASSFAPCMYWM